MSLFQHNSEAVERYLDALRCNPHAVPPQELDPEIAETIRAIVMFYAESDGSSDAAPFAASEALTSAEQRVWDRVMFGMLAPPELEPSYLANEGAVEGSKIIAFPHHPVSALASVTPEPVFIGDDKPPTVSAGFAASEITAVSMPSLGAGYGKPKLRLSFIAAMFFAVFFFMGIMLQQDVLTSDYLRYTPSLGEEAIAPNAADETVQTSNSTVLSRYRPLESAWEGSPMAALDAEVGQVASLNIPISQEKRQRDIVGQMQ
jgi:hypothetical protein